MLESFGILFIVLFIVGIVIGIIKLVDYFNDIRFRLESLEHRDRVKDSVNRLSLPKKDIDLSRLNHLESHLTEAIERLNKICDALEKQPKI